MKNQISKIKSQRYIVNLKSFTILVVVLTFAICALSFAPKAHAACLPVFNGGKTCEESKDISIKKSIKNPPPQSTFRPGDSVLFTIDVTSINAESQVTVTDTLPQYVDFVKGPGQFDSKTKTISFEVRDLKKNETRSFTLETKVVEASKIDFSNNNQACAANVATVEKGQFLRSTKAQDVAHFCIRAGEQSSALPGHALEPQPASPSQGEPDSTTKGGLPVQPPPPMTQAPNTGPEMLGLVALLPTAGLGYLLRRYSKI